MKGSQRHPQAGVAAPAPLSPNSKATAKYANKDGSKYITVPKSSTPADSSQTSPIGAPASAAKSPAAGAGAVTGASSNEPTQPVNRKKQKRRAKAAAKAAAEQAQNSVPPNAPPSPPVSQEQRSADVDPDSHGDQHAQGESQKPYSHQNGYAHGEATKGKKSKKKKKKQGATDPDDDWSGAAPLTPPEYPSLPRGMSKEKIWNTSSQEERERIKEFWLSLNESERKSLVKVEKDAVLKKMKEQQKHTCSCTVCGRKRTAIEEELEGLYDAYYQELEQYANHPNQADGPPLLRPDHSYTPSARNRRRRQSPSCSSHQPSHGRIIEHVGEDDDDDGEEVEYSEEDPDDEEYSEDERSEEVYRSDPPNEFLGFGNSLTVQGGILTVADDLLKNDGKKFIEMMEQLAERRMAREEDAREQYERGYDHPNGDRFGHSHPSPEEEEYDEEDEDYEEEDEDEFESGEDEDTMTEEQRMEEGRRMFQIFAARMFEQRVLSAYKEKVAKERQAKLLEELEDEGRLESQRKAKKAKEAQKRKDKAAKKREAQAEKEARREEAKAAEERERLAEEARKAEEQRAKAEEKRKKREAQKKAEEEERLRKEAERLRRLHEREEAERKAREAKEREKKMREEARLKEKEMREQKEREARERKEQQERDKREKEAKAKANREAKGADREREKEATKLREDKTTQKAAVPIPITLPKRPAPNQTPTTLPALPQQPSASYASPQIPVATPAFPKPQAPMRPRQASQQERGTGVSSHSGSMPSQNPSPDPISPIHANPGPIAPPGKTGLTGVPTPISPYPPSHPASPLGVSAKMSPQPGPFGTPGIGLQFTPSQLPPGFGSSVHREPAYPPLPQIFRNAPPPGFPAIPNRSFPLNPPPGFPGSIEHSVTGISQLFGPTVPQEQLQSHSRQGSGSFEAGAPIAPSQPISRPAPIGRPSSVVQGQRGASGSHGDSTPEPDRQLGSSALLDDTVDGLNTYPMRPPRGSIPSHGRPLTGLPLSGFPIDSVYPLNSNPWASLPQANLFATPPPPGFPTAMPGPWGPPAPTNSAFGGQGVVDRPSEPRNVAFRKMMCRTCEELGGSGERYIRLEVLQSHLARVNSGEPVEQAELMAIAETEGNYQNGGGNFQTTQDPDGSIYIRWVPGTAGQTPPAIQRAVGAPGEIGSPSFVGSSGSSRWA